MLIHLPELSRQGGVDAVAARVRCERVGGALPDRLWFSVDQGEGELPCGGSEGFVAALLPLAMALGEEMRVTGELDGRFVRGVEEYQRVLRVWYPRLHHVELRCAVRPPRSDPPPGAIGAAFSGGVDSFHTLWSHLPPRERVPAQRITHALFVHGFDIPLGDERSYRVAADAYEGFLRMTGVRLVRMSTNARDFTTPPGWETAHGGALIGAALMLQGFLGVFHVPSSRSHETLQPWGSHPRLDPLLSTEGMRIIHDGADCTRVDKLVQTADWEPMRRLLRCCYVRVDGLRNCCRCDNCMHTMAILDVIGKLSDYTTFPLPLERRHVRRTLVLSAHEKACARQLIAIARRTGRRGFGFDLRYSMLRSPLVSLLRRGGRRLRSGARRMLPRGRDTGRAP